MIKHFLVAFLAILLAVSSATHEQLAHKVLRVFRIEREQDDEILTAKALAHHHATLAALDKHKQQQSSAAHPHAHAAQAHPFVVQLNPQRCASSAAVCHKQLQNHPLVGAGRYDILSEDLALATLPLSALQELSSSSSSSSFLSSSSPLVGDFLALSPELKMSSEVSEMRGASSDACLWTRKSSFSGKLEDDPIAHKRKTKTKSESDSSHRHPFQLQFIMHAPSSQASWESFVSFLSALEEEFNTGEDSAQAVVREIVLDVDERNGYHGARRIKALAHGMTVSAWRTNPHRPTAATRARSLSWKSRSSGHLKTTEDEPAVEKITGEVRVTDCASVYTIAERLAARPEVISISRHMPAYTMNKYAQYTCDTGTYNVSSPIRTMRQMSSSPVEVIGVADTGLDMYNCFFHDPNVNVNYQTYLYSTVLNPQHRKIEQYVAYADNEEEHGGHGTHVAGSLAGDAPSSSGLEDYDMNPNIKLAFFDIGYSNDGSLVSPPINLKQEMLEVLYRSGARIFSNAWGSSNNYYDRNSYNVDSFMRNNPDTLVLFAAGNEGEKGAFTVGGPAVAKNALAVGASVSDAASWYEKDGTSGAYYYDKDSVAYFSSQGPTADGRLKPEVLAPGYFVQSALGTNTSTEPFCAMQYMAGTSMATSVAASFAVTVRRYFVDGFYPSGQPQEADRFVPSGALVKAMMVHSAEPLKYARVKNSDSGQWVVTDLTEYPSISQGYGRLNLNKTLNFKGVPLSTGKTPPSFDLFVVGAADSSSNKHYFYFDREYVGHTYYVLTKEGSVDKLRVTLSYTDYPISSSVWRVMANQLLLTVTELGTSNTFSPYEGSSTTDNTQHIEVSNTKANTWYAINVVSYSLVTSQSYALVVTGSFDVLNDGIPDATSVYDLFSVYNDSGWSRDTTILFWLVIGLGTIVALGLLFFLFCYLPCRCCCRQSKPQANSPDSIAAMMLAEEPPAAAPVVVPNATPDDADIELMEADLPDNSAEELK